jgi:TatD DNase family protein
MHDSHIHLALKPLNKNWKRDVQDFLDLGGKKILTQGTDVLDFTETLELQEAINAHFEKDIVDCALGIHPTIFQEKFFEKEVAEIFECSKKFIERFKERFQQETSKLSAVGETGLDYFQMYKSKLGDKKIEALKTIQKESFKIHVRLAREHNLPLSIHARELNDCKDCVQDTLEILAKEGGGLVKGSFHSYTGDIEKLKDILDMGFAVGFNAIITYPSGENVREILRKTPEDRILFETDGPFLPTQNVRKDKNALVTYGRSAQIKEVIKTAADIKNIPAQKLEEISDQNYQRIFS